MRKKLLCAALSMVMAMGFRVNVYAAEPVDIHLNSAPAGYESSENAGGTYVSEDDEFLVNLDGTWHNIRLNSVPEDYYMKHFAESGNTDQAVSDFPDKFDSGIPERAALFMPLAAVGVLIILHTGMIHLMYIGQIAMDMY